MPPPPEPPQGPPQGPHQEPHGEPPRRTGLVVGLAFAGFFGYLVVNVITGLVALAFESEVAFGVAAGFLALFGIGLGLVFVLLRRSWSIGLGLGFMIGWALTSIVTAGFCTGLNPELYA
ncbi:hypothetical protein EDD27_9148 [Nonomuraea polychroma]|uniref:Uncharacterized protein n=2 Tax=Nonomuraea polychroma TaxID=46176 RepID=A0A438MKQ3_9ACTN|nr:hypothetical protein EDD27_9148 [Nonomuraea polychroma]